MWEFFNQRYVRARKPYRCDEAECEIKVGDLYAYGFGKCEGEPMTQRLCLDCERLAAAFTRVLGYDDGFPLTEMREVLRERHGVEGDPIAWAKRALEQFDWELEQRRRAKEVEAMAKAEAAAVRELVAALDAGGSLRWRIARLVLRVLGLVR